MPLFISNPDKMHDLQRPKAVDNSRLDQVSTRDTR